MKIVALILVGFVIGSIVTYSTLQYATAFNNNIDVSQGKVLLKAV